MRMIMNFKINNKTGSPVKYEKEVHSLCDFAQQRLGFEKPPSIFLNHDKRNAGDTLAKTGYYDPNTMEIHVFATGRHPKDILRSIAHELVHHNQNMNGEFEDSGYAGKGYAQKNPHLRKMETEANDPMLFRDWEDSLKEKENTIYNERRNRKMSIKDWKNNELNENLTRKWGFKMDLGNLSEAKDKKPDEDGDGVPDWADKKPGQDDHAEDDKDKEEIEAKDPEKVHRYNTPDDYRTTKKQKKEMGDKEKSVKENEGDSEDNTGEKEPEGAGDKPKKKGKKKMSAKQQKYFGKKKDADKAVNEIMRRVAKRIMRMKKGKK